MAACRSRASTLLLLLLMALRPSTARPHIDWPLVRVFELSVLEWLTPRGVKQERAPHCDGRVECMRYVSARSEFLADPNATELGCAFGHIADDGSCDIPCWGLSQEVCRCVSRDEANSNNNSIAGLSFAFGLVFLSIGCCACYCVGSELLGEGPLLSPGRSDEQEVELASSPSALGRESFAIVREMEDMDPREPKRDPQSEAALWSDGLCRWRCLCAFALFLFFALWFFFSGFLAAFGFWVLFVQEHAYYNGCF